MDSIQEDLKNIVTLALSLAKAEMELTGEIKQIFRELMLSLGLDSDDLIHTEDQNQNIPLPETPEAKTLLMDILLLTTLSDNGIQKDHIMFLLKILHRINLDATAYIVFPFNISFEELRKKTNFNVSSLNHMLRTKVSHCLKKRIFLPQWLDTMTCFVEKIDQQHKFMIQRFADYVLKIDSSKSNDEIKKMLKVLQSYSVEHFKTEEAFMQKMNYPLLSEHMDAHKEFVGLFREMLTEYKSDRDIIKLQDRIAAKLSWFLNHVRDRDIKAGFFLKVKKFSAVKKNRLLVFHDNPEYAKELNETLNDLGFEAITLSQDVKESFDWISTGDFGTCLITSDKSTFTGVGLLQKIRKNALDIPILLLPLKLNLSDLNKSVKKLRLDHPTNFLLSRPFGIDSLIHLLNMTLFDQAR